MEKFQVKHKIPRHKYNLLIISEHVCLLLLLVFPTDVFLRIKPWSQEGKTCLSALLKSVLFHWNFKTWWQTAKFETTLPLFDKHFSLSFDRVSSSLETHYTILFFNGLEERKYLLCSHISYYNYYQQGLTTCYVDSPVLFLEHSQALMNPPESCKGP